MLCDASCGNEKMSNIAEHRYTSSECSAMFTDEQVYFLCIATHRECLKISREISASPYNLRTIAYASVDIGRYRPNIRHISRPQNNNGVCTLIFAADPAIKHGRIAEQPQFIFRQQRVCQCIGDVLPNFVEYAPTDRRIIIDYRRISSSKDAK